MRFVFAPAAFLLVVGVVAGCGDDGRSTESAAFEQVPWVLGAGIDVDGWEAVAPSAMFDGGTVGGSTGCNRFTAPDTVDGDALDVGAIASTRMACAPPADAVETAYLAALAKVRGWRSEEEGLALLDADGAEVLRYTIATPFGKWQATGLRRGNLIESPIAGTEITSTFGDDGRLVGSAGCNTYSATFTTDRGAIEITPPGATMMACASPGGIMEQESAYLAALPSAVRYRVDGRSLELSSADGKLVASYVRAATP
jgi:heat shock protein HslJ